METSLLTEKRPVNNISTVDGSNFRQLVLQGKGPTAVEFMSYSCSHCATLEPILEKVAEMLKFKVKIFRANIATEQDLSATYKIEGTPTLIMFLNGQAVGRVEGPSPKVATLLTAMAQPFRVRA